MAHASPALGQTDTPIQLMGTVVDEETELPVPNASIELLDRRGSRRSIQLTDSLGRFFFLLPEPGGYQFRADRIGYRSATTPVLWTDDRAWVTVEVRLHPAAILLAPLEVTAWARRADDTPFLRGFEDRRATGIGYFLTREDVARRSPVLVTDILASVPGVRLQSSGRGMQRRIYMGRPADGCPAQIYVDGLLLNPAEHVAADADLSLDDAVSPGSVEGIEVYRGLSTVPAEFLNARSRCGVVAVWTRREQ